MTRALRPPAAAPHALKRPHHPRAANSALAVPRSRKLQLAAQLNAPSIPATLPEPTIVSMRCLAATPGQHYPWHNHAFCEFTFVSDDSATIGYPPGQLPVARDTLLFYHAGERHASWSSLRESPRFWVVHFTAPSSLLAGYPALANVDPARRVWTLRPEQAETFRWLFLQLLNERTREQTLRPQAESAWCNLLLIAVQRWAEGLANETLTQAVAHPDLIKLWHLVNASVGEPGDFQERIHNLPNYDSLRHGFKRAFGCSPRDMMLRLRLQHAKNLLLESSLSIKEIAQQCGYHRQHEFARAFCQQTGAAPTAWRLQPLARLSADAK
jgi:hypothetical protein